MKKQLTAVQWLQDELEELFISTPYINWNKIFEKAEQKEKQQIIDAWKDGFYERDSNGAIYDFIEESIEQYYNKQFKN